MLYNAALKRGVNALHPNELNFLQELLRFFVLSLLFYFDEPVVTELMKPYHDFSDNEEFEQTTISLLLDALKVFLGSKQVEIRKHTLRCFQIILINDQVKTCIDMSSGMPYFSVPTYMTNTYEFLFPTKFYRFAVISKVSLLSAEERNMVKLQTETKKEMKKVPKGKVYVPKWLAEQEVTNTSWFDLIERLNAEETIQFLSSDVFVKLISNTSSISKNVYSKDQVTQIKD